MSSKEQEWLFGRQLAKGTKNRQKEEDDDDEVFFGNQLISDIRLKGSVHLLRGGTNKLQASVDARADAKLA